MSQRSEVRDKGRSQKCRTLLRLWLSIGLRLAHASKRQEAFHHLDMVSCHVGGCWTGLDIVNGNPTRGEIDRRTAD